jgi:plasmid stabilization system protein ParE
MRRHAVIVELAAQQDIEEAYLWLAERDADAAERWFDGLYLTIGTLAILPERCPLAPESRMAEEQIRQIFHGRRQHKYRILFTVCENEVRVLHVLHVRHGARLALGETPLEE